MALLDLPWMLTTFSIARLNVDGSRNLWLVATTGILVEPYLYEQGRYSEAEPSYERSLTIRERQLGADHPDIAQNLNNLAGLYCSQGSYSEAEPLYERSLKITETSLGVAHPHTMTVRKNYVDCLKALTNSLMTSNFPTVDFSID